MAAEYLADGLRAGERVYYVSDSEAGLARFRGALKDVGINTVSAVKRRALVMATHAEAHLRNGRFDGERMLHLLNEAVEEALNDGFCGLRTCGDMSWLLKEPEGAEQVSSHEALLNQFFQGVRAAGMCRSGLPADAGAPDRSRAVDAYDFSSRRPAQAKPVLPAGRYRDEPDHASDRRGLEAQRAATARLGCIRQGAGVSCTSFNA